MTSRFMDVGGRDLPSLAFDGLPATSIEVKSDRNFFSVSEAQLKY